MTEKSSFLADVRSLYYQVKAAVSDQGTLQTTQVFTITPGTPQKLLNSNKSRKRVVLEVRSPTNAKAFFGKDQTVNAAAGIGIQLSENTVFGLVDELPYVHGGEWWADADTASTVVAVTEVN